MCKPKLGSIENKDREATADPREFCMKRLRVIVIRCPEIQPQYPATDPIRPASTMRRDLE